MIAFLGSITFASLCGSVHCAGMCGGFVACYAATSGATGPTNNVVRVAVHVAYHAGRLVTYVMLGLLAGFVGQAVDMTGRISGLQHTAAVVAGVLMIAWGVARLTLGIRAKAGGRPGLIARTVGRGLRAIGDCPPGLRAFAVGLLTTWLPCGWLYAFVLAACGTASPISGALVMIAFWIGTVPILLGLGLGVGALSTPLRRHLPRLTAAAIVVVGVSMIISRGTVIPSGIPAGRSDVDAPATASAEEGARLRVPDRTAIDCPHCREKTPEAVR